MPGEGGRRKREWESPKRGYMGDRWGSPRTRVVSLDFLGSRTEPSNTRIKAPREVGGAPVWRHQLTRTAPDRSGGARAFAMAIERAARAGPTTPATVGEVVCPERGVMGMLGKAPRHAKAN